jgi:Dolichyl-phosphate-mannose-protein mannosyltransferase
LQTLEHILGSGKIAWYRLATLLVSMVAVAKAGLEILPNWQKFPGWEAYWIAQSLVAGKGYCFPTGHEWLHEFVDSNPTLRINDGIFHLTAWADPIYTFCLAGLIWLFGDYHQLAAAVFGLILMLAVLGLTHRLCERLISAPAGVVAVLALVLGRYIPEATQTMTNAMLATTLVVLSALMLVKFLEEPNHRRAGVLGLVLGLTTLGCPTAQLFLPVAAVAVAVCGRKNLRPAVTQAILILVVAAIIVMPWSVRNYVVFGKFVPVRTGFGQIAFIGVVASGGTVAPERLRSHVKPPWTAETPRDAVRKIIQPPYEEQAALERFQLEYAMELLGAEYFAMNEAQRDTWFLQEAKAFLVANPVLTAQLAIANIEVFVRLTGGGGSFAVLVSLLAALGGVLGIRKPAILILALWVGTFVGPFLLAICYYGRYRTPIEPLLVVLAVFAVWRVLVSGISRCTRQPAPHPSS